MTFNKRMLHQSLRGLDGFSARTSLQNYVNTGVNWNYIYGSNDKYSMGIVFYKSTSDCFYFENQLPNRSHNSFGPKFYSRYSQKRADKL